MQNPEIMSETPIGMVELRDELDKIKKRDKELNFRSAKVEEYLNLFVHTNQKQYNEIKEKISKLQIPRLRDQHIYKIIDIMPENQEDLKSLLQGYTITVSNENIKKIIDIVSEYLPKKKDGKTDA
jgi:DNA-directed RNA polymerase subunit F